LNVIFPLNAPLDVGMQATSTVHELPFIVVWEQLSVVILKPSVTDTLLIFILCLLEGSVAVSVFDGLVVPMVTAPKESGPLSCSVG
jgi:hypothetical protein